jgi:uncharacterized protein (DUF2147 family)
MIVSLSEAIANLSNLVDRACNGERIIIAKNNLSIVDRLEDRIMNVIKTVPLVLLGMLLLGQSVYAEQGIQGLWLTEEDKSTVEITLTDDGLVGHIVALKEPLDPEGKVKTDHKNPNPKRHSDSIIGLRIVWGFKAGDDNTWTGGSVYDPNNGKTYHAKMTLRDQQLYLRGSLDRWGLVGRTAQWRRPAKMEAP